MEFIGAGALLPLSQLWINRALVDNLPLKYLQFALKYYEIHY